MRTLQTKKTIKWTLLLAAVVLIYGYTQLGWFGETAKSDTDWLVVLHAMEAEIITTDGEMFITLNKISNNTVLFSDRPDREYQSIDTDVFLGKWEALFESSPPNAALVHAEVGVDTEIVVVELFTPAMRGDEISFPIKIIGGEYTKGEKYTDVNLFIDGVRFFAWNSCMGNIGGKRTCFEQWGAYPQICTNLNSRTNYPGKKCKQVNACKDPKYDSEESWQQGASAYRCEDPLRRVI